MSEIRANSITDAAGTGAPNFPNGLDVAGATLSSIATQAQAQAGTDNTTLMTPLRTAEAIADQVVIPPAGGVTLLGTLTTTSGSSHTLSGLTLTDYKFLILFINGVSPSSSSDSLIFAANGSHRIVGPSDNSGDTWFGSVLVDLAISRFAATIADASETFSTTANAGSAGPCALTNASTSVTIGMTGGNFDAGSIRIYGVK